LRRRTFVWSENATLPARVRRAVAEAEAPRAGAAGEGSRTAARRSGGGRGSWSCSAIGAGEAEVGVRRGLGFLFWIFICGGGDGGLDEDEGRIFAGGRRGALRVRAAEGRRPEEGLRLLGRARSLPRTWCVEGSSWSSSPSFCGLHLGRQTLFHFVKKCLFTIFNYCISPFSNFDVQNQKSFTTSKYQNRLFFNIIWFLWRFTLTWRLVTCPVSTHRFSRLGFFFIF